MGLTIKDIAKFAGVSHTTVSRVINGHPMVKPDTREKISRIIRELKFTPHPSARSLISGRNYNIGLLILYDLQKFPHGFLPAILMGMSNELTRSGYSMTLLFDQVKGLKNRVSPELLTSQRLDGVFILSVETEAEMAYRAARIELPMVLVNQKIDQSDLNYVVADDEAGAYAATKHLIELGHRHIAYIDGPPKFSSSVERRHGYLRALKEAKIFAEDSLQTVGNFDALQAQEGMSRLLDARPDLTAVFAANDLMALGAMKAIWQRGLRTPEEVAVVGFDDTEFAACLELTTVNKPRTQMGAEAAKMMLRMLGGTNNEAVCPLTLPTRLVVRRSSGAYEKKSVE